MTVYHLQLSLPISDNNKYSAGLHKDGRPVLYNTQAYKSMLSIIEAEAQAQGFRRKDNVEYIVKMDVYLANSQADVQNTFKCLFDAVFGPRGDGRIAAGHWKRFIDAKAPRVEMEIMEMDV